MASKQRPDTPEPSAQYKLHCEGAFGGLDKRMDRLDGKVDGLDIKVAKLTGIVTNGLSHKVDTIEKRQYQQLVTLLGVLAGLIGSIVLQVVLG